MAGLIDTLLSFGIGPLSHDHGADPRRSADELVEKGEVRLEESQSPD